jgi:uncharacterized protein
MSMDMEIPGDKISSFCRHWKVRELSLFGSALRTDFRPDSDVDILVSFFEDAGWSLFDLVNMADELGSVFGRPVDLVEKEALRNPFRRESILSTRKIIYAA